MQKRINFSRVIWSNIYEGHLESKERFTIKNIYW